MLPQPMLGSEQAFWRSYVAAQAWQLRGFGFHPTARTSASDG